MSRNRRDEPGDRHRFVELYPRLRRFAAVVAPVEYEPSDIVQDALERTLRRHALADLDDPERYLRTVIVRLASNRRRHLAVRRRASAKAELLASAPRSDVHASDLDDLRRLDPESRAVLFLVEVEGWSYREVAELLRCSEEAARTRAARARRKLRVELSAEGR